MIFGKVLGNGIPINIHNETLFPLSNYAQIFSKVINFKTYQNYAATSKNFKKDNILNYCRLKLSANNTIIPHENKILEGQYHVRFYNNNPGQDDVISPPLTVRVAHAPENLNIFNWAKRDISSYDNVFYAGEEATFICELTGAFPAPEKLTWTINGKAIYRKSADPKEFEFQDTIDSTSQLIDNRCVSNLCKIRSSITVKNLAQKHDQIKIGCQYPGVESLINSQLKEVLINVLYQPNLSPKLGNFEMFLNDVQISPNYINSNSLIYERKIGKTNFKCCLNDLGGYLNYKNSDFYITWQMTDSGSTQIKPNLLSHNFNANFDLSKNKYCHTSPIVINKSDNKKKFSCSIKFSVGRKFKNTNPNAAPEISSQHITDKFIHIKSLFLPEKLVIFDKFSGKESKTVEVDDYKSVITIKPNYRLAGQKAINLVCMTPGFRRDWVLSWTFQNQKKSDAREVDLLLDKNKNLHGQKITCLANLRGLSAC